VKFAYGFRKDRERSKHTPMFVCFSLAENLKSLASQSSNNRARNPLSGSRRIGEETSSFRWSKSKEKRASGSLKQSCRPTAMRRRANDLLGPDAGSRAGAVLTHLTSRDGVPHVRPGEPECGDRIQRGASGLFRTGRGLRLRTLHSTVLEVNCNRQNNSAVEITRTSPLLRHL